MSSTSLSELERELAAATAEYIQARSEASIARGHENTALNRLNGVQKRIDEALGALRKTAAGDSDWRRNEGAKP